MRNLRFHGGRRRDPPKELRCRDRSRAQRDDPADGTTEQLPHDLAHGPHDRRSPP
jgi:hypothetical protein